MRIVRSRRGARLRTPPSRRSARRRARADSSRCFCPQSVSWSRRSSTPTRSVESSVVSPRGIARGARPARSLGSRRPPPPRRRTDPERPRGLEKDQEPVFAYGFEDLTGAEWALIEALSARADVTVSIPYEPARPAFAALEGTVTDLAALAAGAVEELPPVEHRLVPPALVHLERELFGDGRALEESLDGSVQFLEGAGVRGTVELVATEVIGLVRADTPPDRIGIVCESPSVGARPSSPFSPRSAFRMHSSTRCGSARLPLVGRCSRCFATPGVAVNERSSSPFSARPSRIERRSVDFVEGRLRGRAIVDQARVEEESEKLRGAHVPALVELRAEADPVLAARTLARTMIRNAWGLDAPPVGGDARGDARAYRATARTFDELSDFSRLDGRGVAADDVIAALERTAVRPVAAGETGRVAVLDYGRARTRVFDAVFLLGLEEGSLPRRDRPSPLLDDDSRRELGGQLAAEHGRSRPVPLLHRLHASDPSALSGSRGRERRRRSAGAEPVLGRRPRALACGGLPRDSSASAVQPYLDAGLGSERAGATARAGAPDDRRPPGRRGARFGERLVAPARARSTCVRPSYRPPKPHRSRADVEQGRVLGDRAQRFADCSSAWLVERVIDPKTIDAEPDPMLEDRSSTRR